MKWKLLYLVFAFSLTNATHGQAPDPVLAPPQALSPSPLQSQAARLAAGVLTRYHYKAAPLDDAMSEKIFDQYLKALDNEKLLFVQSDIDQLSAYRTRLDNAILEQNLAIPFTIFNLYSRRMNERYAYARSLLKQPFNFQVNETYQVSREKESWAKSEAEIADIWRRRVKNDWLRLKLAGADDKNIAATLDKRYETAMRRIARVKSEDAFQTFMNAYTMAIEPHTNYMGPRASEEFDISMRLSLVGIGAVLSEKDDFITIRELVPGGPAQLSGLLKVGDRIVGVGQGAGGAMTDVLGWRVDDVVVLIRGTSDTVVSLDVLPAEAGPDGKHKIISLVRKTISLEEQAAKKTILSVPNGRETLRVGVITLPSFYEDFEGRRRGDAAFKSAARDVARLLGELKKENVDSVLIDLRNNGGGSLGVAVEMTGLFIDRGPVVQQRFASGEITVQSDTRAGVAWDGPMGVLINRGSASASEIFAAAIQDYGRGLVIGESSFGKGTVQSLVDLDQLARSESPKLGGLKLTIAQFFRINGGTTQLRGVTPDITFPTVSDAVNFGESSFDNALPWMQIRAADYPASVILKEDLPILQKQHLARVRVDKDFRYLEEDISELKLQQKRNQVSLNEAERRREQQARESRVATREAHQRDTTAMGPGGGRSTRDDGLQPDERNLASELAAEKERKNARDYFLIEASQILGDAVTLRKSRSTLAGQPKPKPM
jgi:carboxyl-terminal processing protease